MCFQYQKKSKIEFEGKKMIEKNNNLSRITRQNTLMIGLICLCIGFLMGVGFTIYRLDRVTANDQLVGKDEKEESLKAELLQNPQNISAWTQLGHVYFDSDQYVKAIEAYEKSLSLKPNDPDVLNDLGVMYRRTGNHQKAIESFDKAIAFDQKHENARFNKGIVLMNDIKDRKKALETWEALLEINPIVMVGKNQSLDQLIRHYKEHE